ncbi:MAG: 4-(cytidine 5'-diphospho)-2-C-methyl-D-erythritol kinase [Bacteroidales bacterium]|nr:4-(cytidine 5'-diphospho)-2-C-methyl-D-erythritol kinase [Bacteroidales bacterium]
MTIQTCTKVNIGLNVLRRRADGFHDLETLFVPYYGFGDVLSIEPAEHTSILIDFGGALPWDPMKDLTVQAWRLLKMDFPALPEVSIRLEKHSPVGAGLGGGSADAAFMLRALNEIGDLRLSDSELSAYAARLGSDCAFFSQLKNVPIIPLHPQGTAGRAPQTPPVACAPNLCQAMYATGRGEVLEPFDIDLSGYDLEVEVPEGVAVSTREAYAGIVPDCSRPALKELLAHPVEAWKDFIVNDFEKSVFAAHPQIAALKQKFYEDGAIYAAMSGSGSAVFGLFPK